MSQNAAVSQGAVSKGAGNAGKNKGSLLSKAGKAAPKGRVTEAELLRRQGDIRPEDVLCLEAATEGELAGQMKVKQGRWSGNCCWNHHSWGGGVVWLATPPYRERGSGCGTPHGGFSKSIVHSLNRSLFVQLLWHCRQH